MRKHARPGALKHRVTVQENSPTRNSYGEKDDAWAAVETVYAAIRTIGADEPILAGKEVPVHAHVFTMRYRTDLGTSDTRVLSRYRLAYDARTFAIRGVMDMGERHKYLEVLAEEVTA